MKYLKISLFLLIIGVIIYSCDKVDPPYIIEQGGDDTTACPVPEFPDTFYVKKVLLEEFTGHKCPNCPEGSLVANQLKGKYNGQLILMSIHAGTFADPSASGPYSYDFRTIAGDILNDEFQVWGYPTAMINRIEISQGNWVMLSTQWEPAIDGIIGDDPLLGMQIISEFELLTRKLCIHVKTKYLEDFNQDIMLSIYIIEDNIINWQKNDNSELGPVPDWEFYSHNHVLRDAVNTAWGDVLSNGFMPKDTSIIKTYEYYLNTEWNYENCAIVAFTYNADTKEIIQAEENHVE